MGLEEAVAEQTKHFTIRKSDFLPWGMGLWNYCVRSTKEAKMLREKAEDGDLRDSVNSLILCAYSIATVGVTAWGIHELYDLLK